MCDFMEEVYDDDLLLELILGRERPRKFLKSDWNSKDERNSYFKMRLTLSDYATMDGKFSNSGTLKDQRDHVEVGSLVKKGHTKVKAPKHKRKQAETLSQEDSTRGQPLGAEINPLKWCCTSILEHPSLKTTDPITTPDAVDHKGEEESMLFSPKISTTQCCEYGDQGFAFSNRKRPNHSLKIPPAVYQRIVQGETLSYTHALGMSVMRIRKLIPNGKASANPSGGLGEVFFERNPILRNLFITQSNLLCTMGSIMGTKRRVCILTRKSDLPCKVECLP